MRRILDRYEQVSGQMINYSKSAVNFSPNTTEEDRWEVCTQLGVREVHEPGNYLGMLMHIGRRKMSSFSFLLERVEQKLQGWHNKTLSKSGKVTLLKNAAQVVPNFWMSLFLIPIEICEGLEKKMNKFWWTSSSTGGGIRWLSWDRLCESKEGGGFGFKKLRDFNISMLAKQGWRFINNSNPLVTSLMRAKYFPGSDFLNAELGDNPSYIWRSIHEAQQTVRQGCRRNIGNGRNTNVWKDPWLPCIDNGYIITEMPSELQHIQV
ncbi:putative mitochondrial protein AtMg00310 [Apium graveolens]|uniref:putative mitochondrial protein AtMg00310 n=1 Tax=Apium graveolens TaxID=4045 RepID=UPI003D7AD836